MKTIGIKLADGSFFPVLEEDTPSEKSLELTTAHNNQTKVMVDLYRSESCSMDDAEYVDSLQIENLVAHPNGDPDISFTVSIDKDNNLSAKMTDQETGEQSNSSITLVSRTQEERLVTDEYDISDALEADNNSEPEKTEEKSNTAEDNNSGSGVKKAVAGIGLLSLADKIIAEEKAKNQDNQEEVTPTEETAEDNILEDIPEEIKIPTEENETGDLQFDDLPDDNIDVKDSENIPEENQEDEGIDDFSQPVSDEDMFNDPNLFGVPEDITIEKSPEEQETETADTDIDISNEAESSEGIDDILADIPDIDEPADNIENAEEISDSEPALDEDIFDLPDLDENTTEQLETSNDELKDTSEDELDNNDIFSDIPDLDDNVNMSTDNEEPEVSADESLDNLDDLGSKPDFDTTLEETVTPADDDIFNIPDTENTQDETIVAEEPADNDDNMFDDLPDFDNISDTTSNDTTGTENITEEDNSFDLPDELNDNKPIENITSDDKFFGTNLYDFSASENNNSDNFDLPDFPEDQSSDNTPDFSDNFFDDSNFDFDTDNNSANANSDNLSFTGLYDKETEMGNSANHEDDVKKKTKLPVIICIICAVICLIATLLILFIIPSKYNLLKKSNNSQDNDVVKEVVIVEKKQAEELEDIKPQDSEKGTKVNVIVEEKKDKPKDTVKELPVPKAQEDEVIVIEKAEKVIPEQPEVVKEKLEDISYKIKWGDTLWDISNTYYKNPWRYKYIARYNGISNPDHIISGRRIIIPAE